MSYISSIQEYSYSSNKIQYKNKNSEGGKMRKIFDFIFGNVTVFNNVLYDWILITVYGLIAYIVCYRFVGSLYKGKVISGSSAGSMIYWTIWFTLMLILIGLTILISLLVRYITQIFH